MGGSVAAIVMIRKQEELVERFRAVGATTTTTAKSIDELGVDTHLVWNGMVRRSVVREASPGLFYLDALSWKAVKRRRSLMTAIAFAVLGIFLVVWLLAGSAAGGF